MAVRDFPRAILIEITGRNVVETYCCPQTKSLLIRIYGLSISLMTHKVVRISKNIWEVYVPSRDSNYRSRGNGKSDFIACIVFGKSNWSNIGNSTAFSACCIPHGNVSKPKTFRSTYWPGREIIPLLRFLGLSRLYEISQHVDR